MNFVPNYEQEFDGTVSNSLEEPREVDMYTEGELNDYLIFTTPTNFVVEAQQTHPFKFKIKLPDKFEIPGAHEGIIWADEHVEEQAGVAIAKVRVGIRIILSVPYPGKYAAIGLNVKNTNVNDTVVFDIEVSNLGKENITSARGEINLMDIGNKTIVILQTESKPIETTIREILQATWFSNANPGIYRAIATVFYDGETTKTERTFNLGAPLIKIFNVSSKEIVNGTIAKIPTQIQSYWSQDIKDVYMELSVTDAKGNQIAGDKSQNINVPPFSMFTLINYWDTTPGVEPGDYKGLLVLHYIDKNDTAEFNIKVIAKPGFAIGIEILVIIAAVIAVIVAAFFMIKRKGNKYKQKRLM